MKQKHWPEFEERAKSFGHNLDALLRGEEITDYLTIQSPNKFRRFIAATPEQRKLRMEQFFTLPLQRRQRLAQGVHDRVECYAFAEGTLLEADLPKINTHFPVTARTLSVAEKRIGKNECWDVTAPITDPPMKTYTLLNVGCLILEEGASIIVQGDVFLFLCQKLIIHPGKKNDESFQIGILPGRPASDFQHKTSTSIHEMQGICGIDGKSDYVRHTWLGPILINEIHPTDLNGLDGQNGENGLPGNPGSNGNMCYIAEIAIRELHGDLIVYTRAGNGVDGTDGDSGGDGGNGGCGTEGCKFLGGILPSGYGGNGGCGGAGGNGGHGGHGGISSNIYLLVPPEAESQVRCKAFPSLGGKGGRGGTGGKGGLGGKGGPANEYVALGKNGINGTGGLNGVCGKNGKTREAATVFINEMKMDTNVS